MRHGQGDGAGGKVRSGAHRTDVTASLNSSVRLQTWYYHYSTTAEWLLKTSYTGDEGVFEHVGY